MKKVFLVFLAVLLVVTFILGVYFHAENNKLKMQGKVRVFSLNSWLSSFSHFSVPDLSLKEIWTNSIYYFTYYAGSEITAESLEDIYDSFLPVGNSSSWDSLTVDSSFVGSDARCYSRVYDLPDEMTGGGSVLFENVPRTAKYKAAYQVYVCSWIADKTLLRKVDLTDKNGMERFAIRASDTLSLLWSYVSSAFDVVYCLMPWNNFVDIDIPNWTNVSSCVSGSGVYYEIDVSQLSQRGALVSSPSCVEWYKGSTGELLCKGYECETLGTPNYNIDFDVKNAFFDRMSGKIYVYLFESEGE